MQPGQFCSAGQPEAGWLLKQVLWSDRSAGSSICLLSVKLGAKAV